jgi:hypothetical protein
MEAEWRPAKNWCEGSQVMVTFCQGAASEVQGKFAGRMPALQELPGAAGVEARG